MSQQMTGVRKNLMSRNFIFVIGLILLIITLSACTPAQFVTVPEINNSNEMNGQIEAEPSGTNMSTTSGSQLAELDLTSQKEMIGFEGSIFVASTNLVKRLWVDAGWKISSQPIDTDSDKLPADCTLYPHEGVADQWVGTCIGYVLVPRAGAQHISVMHTARDGNTTMIQVAPVPFP
jgi:hypothetical protein